MECACSILSSVAYSDRNISPHYLKSGTIFEKRNFFEQKNVCQFSLEALSETFLGLFAKLPKVTICFFISVYPVVRLSARNNSAPTGQIFTKFDIWVFEKLSTNFKIH